MNDQDAPLGKCTDNMIKRIASCDVETEKKI